MPSPCDLSTATSLLHNKGSAHTWLLLVVIPDGKRYMASLRVWQAQSSGDCYESPHLGCVASMGG